jgi:hypothetical protein
LTAKRSQSSTADIQKLLDEKRQIEQWLQRLNTAADGTPEGVRAKVASDYGKRHEAILEELQGFREELSSKLEQQRAGRDDLAAREARESERMAEAELRHTVGEFDEARWTELRSEILDSLVKIRKELKAAEDEIAGMEDVVSAVSTAESEPVPEPEPEPEIVEAPAAEEAAPEPAQPAQTDAFDELEFLRSVTGDEVQPRRRLSGAQPRLSTEDLVSPVTHEEEQQLGDTPRPPRTSVVGAEGVGPLKEQPKPMRGSAKVVKCGECGAPNLPTEWYCERCGAELAAL